MARLEVEFLCEPSSSDLAGELLARYETELASRLVTGFDPALAVPVAAEELVMPRGALLVARLEGGAIACGAVRKLDEKTAELKRMWVDPDARGRGIGRRLLAALEQTALEIGCDLVRLDTNAQLSEAVALYDSAGYREIPAYNDNLYAERWFEKQLG
jgi:GNAT superfamily N-acetyltransferase